MKQFLKENFVLVTGVSLPLLLVALLIIMQAMTVPAAPPAYKTVFAFQNHYQHKPFRFDVDKDGKLAITYTEKQGENDRDYDYSATLYVYDPAEDSIWKTQLKEPGDAASGKTIDIPVPSAIASVTLDPSATSPDGYALGRRPYRSGSFFTEMFGYHNRNRLSLIKDRHYVGLPVEEYHYYDNETFIGWVIEE